MPRITAVRVDPGEVDGMVKTLLTVYAAKAEALAHAAVAYADGREPRESLDDARAELAAAADALDGLGWNIGPRLEAAELAGESRLVREVPTPRCSTPPRASARRACATRPPTSRSTSCARRSTTSAPGSRCSPPTEREDTVERSGRPRSLAGGRRQRPLRHQ